MCGPPRRAENQAVHTGATTRDSELGLPTTLARNGCGHQPKPFEQRESLAANGDYVDGLVL